MSGTPTGDLLSANSRTHSAKVPKGGFPLSGPSSHPDPRTHAYRQDLADVALAGQVVASHYADPLTCRLARGATLLLEPDLSSEPLAELAEGAELRVLDNSRGWAWGYGSGLVGYVPASVIA